MVLEPGGRNAQGRRKVSDGLLGRLLEGLRALQEPFEMPFEEGFYALLEASGGPSGGFWRPETLLEGLLCPSRGFWRRQCVLLEAPGFN